MLSDNEVSRYAPEPILIKADPRSPSEVKISSKHNSISSGPSKMSTVTMTSQCFSIIVFEQYWRTCSGHISFGWMFSSWYYRDSTGISHEIQRNGLFLTFPTFPMFMKPNINHSPVWTWFHRRFGKILLKKKATGSSIWIWPNDLTPHSVHRDRST